MKNLIEVLNFHFLGKFVKMSFDIETGVFEFTKQSENFVKMKIVKFEFFQNEDCLEGFEISLENEYGNIGKKQIYFQHIVEEFPFEII